MPHTGQEVRAPRMLAVLALDPLPELKTEENFQLDVSVDAGASTGTLASTGYRASNDSSTGIPCKRHALVSGVREGAGK